MSGLAKIGDNGGPPLEDADELGTSYKDDTLEIMERGKYL